MDKLIDNDATILDGYWHYDTEEEELLGALEEQASLLKDAGFDWLNNRLDVNIEEIIIQLAWESKCRYESSTLEQREENLCKISELLSCRKDRRVKPGEPPTTLEVWASS